MGARGFGRPPIGRRWCCPTGWGLLELVFVGRIPVTAWLFFGEPLLQLRNKGVWFSPYPECRRTFLHQDCGGRVGALLAVGSSSSPEPKLLLAASSSISLLQRVAAVSRKKSGPAPTSRLRDLRRHAAPRGLASDRFGITPSAREWRPAPRRKRILSGSLRLPRVLCHPCGCL